MPFKSEAQRRLFHAKEDRGEMPHKTVEEWEHATKNKKKLPYHKKKEASIPMLLLGGAAANAGHEHANKAMIHATKKLQKANSQEKRAMDETIERAFLNELQQIGVEKLAEEKVKKATGLVGSLGMDTVKQLGRSAVAGASKLVRAHPLKSVAGAAAVGRYVMPKQKESAAMAGAAKKLKKLSMGADCY